jgi:hypothetical protein
MRVPFRILGGAMVITDLRRRQQVAFYGLGLNLPSILTSDLLIRAGGRDWLTRDPIGSHHHLEHIRVVAQCCHRQLGCLHGRTSAQLLCTFLPRRCLGPKANPVTQLCHVDGVISHPG